MAHSAAGGVGFGAGGLSFLSTALALTCLRCCDWRWLGASDILISWTNIVLCSDDVISYHVIHNPLPSPSVATTTARLRCQLYILFVQLASYSPSPSSPRFLAAHTTMPFLESLQDGLDRILPKRRNDVVISKSVSGGIGSTVGVVRYHDNVSHPPAPFPSFWSRSWCCRVAVWLGVAMHLNLDVLSNFGYVIPLSSALCRCLHGPVWHAGLAPLRPPAMGHMARGHFLIPCSLQPC